MTMDGKTRRNARRAVTLHKRVTTLDCRIQFISWALVAKGSAAHEGSNHGHPAALHAWVLARPEPAARTLPHTMCGLRRGAYETSPRPGRARARRQQACAHSSADAASRARIAAQLSPATCCAPAAGISSSMPTRIVLSLSPFALRRSPTLTPYCWAMPDSVSPLRTL